MKVYFLTLLLCLIIASNSAAQDPLEQILESGDVEHFIKTFPLFKNDIEKYGIQYEAREGSFTVPEAMNTQSDFYGILKKHGWDENFFAKFGAIMIGYSTVVYGQEMKKADADLDRSIKEIDANPNLSEEMKTQLKEQMRLTKGVLKEQNVTFKKSIHTKDLEMVRPHIEGIKKVIDK